jgi:hypothetical protein
MDSLESMWITKVFPPSANCSLPIAILQLLTVTGIPDGSFLFHSFHNVDEGKHWWHSMLEIWTYIPLLKINNRSGVVDCVYNPSNEGGKDQDQRLRSTWAKS